jgi:transposase
MVATIAVTRRFDLTDGQWAVLELVLPVSKRAGRPSQWTKRQLIDGIRWRVRTGAPWRDVPGCYGSWQAVYGLFRRSAHNYGSESPQMCAALGAGVPPKQ